MSHDNLNPPDERQAVERVLELARRVLAGLEEQAAGHTFLTLPVPLKIDLENKRAEVTALGMSLSATPTTVIQGERVRISGKRPPDFVVHFQDREQECKKLGSMLAEPTTRLVSIIGHGGMGKTALASKVLRDLESLRWPHTVEKLPLWRSRIFRSPCALAVISETAGRKATSCTAWEGYGIRRGASMPPSSITRNH